MKPTKSIDDRICNLAIETWYEWYAQYVAPAPRRITAPGEAENEGQVFEVFARAIRGNTEHGDMLLSRLLTSEARRQDWPASIHAIICEYYPLWQSLVMCSALRMTAHEMARALRLHQSDVELTLPLMRDAFVSRVKLLPNTKRMVERYMRVEIPPAARLRLAVVD